jgi:hypothetical protein
MECVCVPFRGWLGKTKYLSAFEWGMVVGARGTGLSVSRTATLLDFWCSTFSRLYQDWSSTQRTSSQLDTTVGSIGVNMGQHPCGMLSTPSSPCSDELRLFLWQNGVQLNIRKVFLMFFLHSVYIDTSGTANGLKATGSRVIRVIVHYILHRVGF